jgi:hypothetical protein
LTIDSEKRVTETERRVKILEYVSERQKANQNTTKTTVITYMKEKRLSSRETTLNLINDLIREGKLTKKEINSQVHFLTINEDNEFNKIYNWLIEIEKFMDTIIAVSFKELDAPQIKRSKLKDVYRVIYDFQVPYTLIIRMMLTVLSKRANNKIHSDKDQYILFPKIIKLITNVNPYFQDQEKEVLNDMIVKVRELRPNEDIKHRALKFGIKFSVIDDMVTMAERFKKEFNS